MLAKIHLVCHIQAGECMQMAIMHGSCTLQVHLQEVCKQLRKITDKRVVCHKGMLGNFVCNSKPLPQQNSWEVSTFVLLYCGAIGSGDAKVRL